MARLIDYISAMISVGGHYVTGLLVAPWMENAAPRILCGWQHNDSVSEATRSEVNVEMATSRHVVLLCVAGARFAAAFMHKMLIRFTCRRGELIPAYRYLMVSS